jgi:hypothetical protein
MAHACRKSNGRRFLINNEEALGSRAAQSSLARISFIVDDLSAVEILVLQLSITHGRISGRSAVFLLFFFPEPSRVSRSISSTVAAKEWMSFIFFFLRALNYPQEGARRKAKTSSFESLKLLFEKRIGKVHLPPP